MTPDWKGLFDKAKEAAKDPANQAKAKEAGKKFMASRKAKQAGGAGAAGGAAYGTPDFVGDDVTDPSYQGTQYDPDWQQTAGGMPYDETVDPSQQEGDIGDNDVDAFGDQVGEEVQDVDQVGEDVGEFGGDDIGEDVEDIGEDVGDALDTEDEGG